MKTISENHNGKVLKTSNGFSVKNAVKKLKKVLTEINADFSVKVANTNSTYFEIATDNMYFRVRISDHTKRTYGFESVDLTNYTFEKEILSGVSYEIFQAVDKNTFQKLLTIIK